MNAVPVVFVDVEASGLHDGSFPVEIGWATASRDLGGDSFLVVPHPTWSLDAGFATGIHGISVEECEASGIRASDAATRLNTLFSGMTVYSDAPATDGYWLRRLYEAAGVAMEFALGDAVDVMAAAMGGIHQGDSDRDELFYGIIDLVATVYPRPHRARPDAVSLAATCLAMADPAFMQEVCARLPGPGADQPA